MIINLDNNLSEQDVRYLTRLVNLLNDAEQKTLQSDQMAAAADKSMVELAKAHQGMTEGIREEIQRVIDVKTGYTYERKP